MSTFAIYSQTDFPAILKWQALAFMRVEWPYIFTDDERFLTETYPIEFQPVHFVVTEGEILISYAATVNVTLRHANRSYKVCGLGNVFTFPPYRREGNGHKVLKLATNVIKESDVDVAILFCEPTNISFYASEDWISTLSPTYIADGKDHYKYDEQRMMLFISNRGKQGQSDFEQQPVHVDWAW
jgi:hypothetical protein